jgi:serine/threonine protein kinase
MAAAQPERPLMESQSTSVLQSKATLLSILESIVGPQASDTGSSNESEYQDDVTDAAVALTSFLETAYHARLIPRSMMKLRGICTVSPLGEGADYRAEVFEREGQKPFVVKYVKALVPVVNPAGVISIAAAPRLAKVLREMLVAQHALVKANRHILNVDAYGWDDVDVAMITPCLISEYAELGTMRQYLVARSQQDPDARYLLWKGVAEGLLALHACDIVHGDVKLDNVLITADHTTSAIVPKIADFGSSLFRHPDVKNQRYWGTAIYNAPEISSQEGAFVTFVLSFDQLKACDVYSFGLLVWENFKDGGLYVPAETLRTGTGSASRDWRTLALHELGQLHQLPVQVRQQIQTALWSTLHSQPTERKTIVELLRSVGLDIDTYDILHHSFY